MSIQAPLSDRRVDHATGAVDRRVTVQQAPGAYASGRQTGWRLSPGQRKLAVAVHVVLSVGLLGLSAAMLVLASAAVLTSDIATTRAAYQAMAIFTRGPVPVVAVSALLSGIVLSLGTPWGLIRHTWIVVKLGLTVATILCGMLLLSTTLQRVVSRVAAAPSAGALDLGRDSLLLVAAAAANVLMLVAATFISVYKPWGIFGSRTTAAARPKDLTG